MAISGVREASRLIFVDELTGLYNRRFMRQYLRDRMDEFVQSHTPLCVVMFDLDGFKQVNDTYGHLEGDLILKHLAQLIREAIPPGAYAIRFAGDEFFVFLEGVDGAGGVGIAEAIRERVAAQPFSSLKVPSGIPVQLSVGVAACPEDATSATDLIEAADQALYESKRRGKNCVSRAVRGMLPPEEEILRRFPCPRVVGRYAELEELERALLDSADRKHRFLLLEGHRGLGKSRLLTEVMQRAGSRGLRCFFTRCLESHREVPYSSLTPIVSECLTREHGQVEAVMMQLSGPTLTELGTIIPELATTDRPRETPAPEERRSLLFHGMGDLLCLLSEQSPLVLFLDDVHFVDDASLEVLYRLLDRDDGGVVIYAAGRSEALTREDEAPPSLLRLFGLLRESPRFSNLNLGPLTTLDVKQMLGAILEEHTSSDAFLQHLFEASGGIPLFVEEALKGLIAKGAITETDGIWDLAAVDPTQIPASLEAAVFGALETLDRETHAMIWKAAVVGPHVDITLLAGVLGKDPGETQQLVDRGKKQRVFEEPGPLSDEDEVRFLSQCFQQIVYSGVGRDDRRHTHRVVGEVTERLAGPQVEGVLLGPLAYHFERSDEAAKAEHYRRRVQELSVGLFSAEEVERELSFRVGAQEFQFQLDEQTFPLAEQFLRSLTVAVKNMRLYPEGSQRVSESVAAATATLLELLAHVEMVAFAEESQALLANGKPLDRKGLHQVVQDVLHIYTEHGIRRCTFERGITEADVMGLLRILSSPSQGIQHDLSFWPRRLESLGIDHVRVFPVIYLAGKEGKSVWRREQSEARLDDPSLLLARDVLRSLAATVDNIRLYPPESELITLTLDQLDRQSQALFERLPSLTVAMAEGTIVVNATRPNPRQFGITIEILQKLMEDSGLTSLTIRRGVTQEEFRVLLTELARPLEESQRAPTFWRGVLEGRGIRTIEVGTHTYTAAAGVESPPETIPGQISETEELLQRVVQWLNDPLGAFLEPQVQEGIAHVLGNLRGIGREDLAQQLVERSTGALGELDASLRRQAAEGLLMSLKGVDDESADWMLDLVLDPITDVMRKETHSEAFEVQMELSTEILKRLSHRRNLVRGAALAEALTRPRSGVHGDHAVEPIRRFVDSLAPHFLKLILEDEDTEGSRVAATLLRVQGNAAVRQLSQELGRATSVEKMCRIVAVLDVVAPALASDFFFLLGHPELQVRGEMARTIARLSRRQAVRFLRHAMNQSDPEVVLGALECVQELGGGELVDSMIGLLDHPPSEEVLRVACLRLGTLKDTRAVDPLLRILGHRPRLFGLRKGLPEDIRTTAARTLGELGSPEAREGLERAFKDPSNTVRAAARLALHKIQQEIEPAAEQ